MQARCSKRRSAVFSAICVAADEQLISREHMCTAVNVVITSL